MAKKNDKPVMGKRQLRKLNRRQAILNAAKASFIQNGYAGTSMSGLLKRLGGSKATLWSYFRSKDELFETVIEEVSASFRDQLSLMLTPSADLRQGLHDFCLSFLRKLEEPDVVATWRLIVGESGRFPKLGAIFYKRAGKQTEDVITDFLIFHMKKRLLRRSDPHLAAELLLSLCTGRQNRLLWGMKRRGPSNLEGLAAQIVDLFLRFYGARVTERVRRGTRLR
jgi:AcrR family transcriptional regulator